MKLISVLVMTAAFALAAQDRQIETQVPLDSSGTVMSLTPAMRERAGLFPDVEKYISARMFRTGDSLYVLEIVFQQGGSEARERIRMNSAAAANFRRDLSGRLAAAPSPAGMDQEGRTGLIVRQTAMGLGFYGWAVPAFLNMEGGREVVATYMLVGAASFALPYQLTRERPVSLAQSTLNFYGATRGILYGTFVKFMLAPHTDSQEATVGPMLAGSLAGSLAGFQIAGQKKWDIGRAELTGVMGDFGIGLGVGLDHLTGMWDDGDLDEPEAHAMMLGASAAGLAAGSWLARREHYTRGDAYVLRMSGALGVQLMLPVAGAVSDKKAKAYTTGAIVGGLLGVGIGNRMLREQDFTFGEGALISCGHLAGGLLAGGLTYLFDTGENFDELAYLSTTALGSLAGHALLYHALAGKNLLGAGPLDRLHIGLAPAGLLCAAGKMQVRRPGQTPPLLSLQLMR